MWLPAFVSPRQRFFPEPEAPTNFIQKIPKIGYAYTELTLRIRNTDASIGSILRRRKMIRKVIILLLLIFIAVACKTPEPEVPSPEEILAGTAGRMSEMDGFRFAFEISGAPVFLDQEKSFSLASAEGFYVAPDRAIASVRVLAPGLATEVSILSIGQDQWLSGLVNDDWMALPPEWGINPLMLIDSKSGIVSSLIANISDIEYVGMSDLDEGLSDDFYLIRGSMDGNLLNEMSGGLLGPGQLNVQLWIVPETYELGRVIITSPGSSENEKTTEWQIDILDFDQTVDIIPPAE